MTRSYDQYCALARALDRVGERWSLLIIRELLISPRRYSDLREALPGIATNLLADRMRFLQEEGIVERVELPPPAASMVWRLTESGRELEEAVLALTRWGGRWMVEPRRGSAFRPEWLLLALRAIFLDATEGPDLMLEINVEGGSVHLCFSAEGPPEAWLGPATDPDVRLTGSPAAILEVATGLSRVADLGSKRGQGVSGSQKSIARLQGVIDVAGRGLWPDRV